MHIEQPSASPLRATSDLFLHLAPVNAFVTCAAYLRDANHGTPGATPMPHPARIALARQRALAPTFRVHPAYGIGCAALAALVTALATFTVLAYAI